MFIMVGFVDDVRVYIDDEDEDEVFASFDDWAKANGYMPRFDMRAMLLEKGYSEDEVNEEDDKMLEMFYEWCDDWGIQCSE